MFDTTDVRPIRFDIYITSITDATGLAVHALAFVFRQGSKIMFAQMQGDLEESLGEYLIEPDGSVLAQFRKGSSGRRPSRAT